MASKHWDTYSFLLLYRLSGLSACLVRKAHFFFLLHNFTALLTIVSLYKMDNSSFTSTPSMSYLSMSDGAGGDSSGPKGPVAESEAKVRTVRAVSQ